MVDYVSRRADAAVRQGLVSGGVVALVGPRGSGKTATLKRALAGLETHERIEIDLDQCEARVADPLVWAAERIDPNAPPDGDLGSALERPLARGPIALVIDHLDSVDTGELFEGQIRKLAPLAPSRVKIVVTSRLSFTYVNAAVLTLPALPKDELAALALAWGAPMSDEDATLLAREIAPTAGFAEELSQEVASGSLSWADVARGAISRHPGEDGPAPRAFQRRRSMVATHLYALPDALQAGLAPVARGEAIPERSAPPVLIREGVLRQGEFGRVACPIDQRLLGSILGVTRQ